MPKKKAKTKKKASRRTLSFSNFHSLFLSNGAICVCSHHISLFHLASLLLDNFLAQLTSEGSHECKAVYLHVLSSNESAVKFYEHRNFTFHRTLLNYYNINGARLDGFCYVLYINGGKPPWSLLYPSYVILLVRLEEDISC